MNPSGPETLTGTISINYLKDPTDPRWKDDAGMNEWRDFMTKHMPGADVTDLSYVFAQRCQSDDAEGAAAMRR